MPVIYFRDLIYSVHVRKMRAFIIKIKFFVKWKLLLIPPYLKNYLAVCPLSK